MLVTHLPPYAPFSAWTSAALTSDLRKIRKLFDAERKNRRRNERPTAHYWNRYSPKLDRHVDGFTDLGRDYWVLIESDSTISWFTEQPSRVWLQIRRRLNSEPFNMAVERCGVIECHRYVDDEKPSSAVLDSIEAEQQFCELQGFLYVPFRRFDIERQRQWIENWKRMLRYLYAPYHRLEQRVFGYVSTVGELTLGELERLLKDVGHTEACAAIYGLLHRGVLVAPDLAHQPLSSRITVGIANDN